MDETDSIVGSVPGSLGQVFLLPSLLSLELTRSVKWSKAFDSFLTLFLKPMTQGRTQLVCLENCYWEYGVICKNNFSMDGTS